MLSACDSRTTLIEEHNADLQAEEPNELVVVDYFPEDNVLGVPKNIQPYYFFNRAVENPVELELALANIAPYYLSFSYLLDFDAAGVTFVPDGTVYGQPGYETFQMTLGLGSAGLESSKFSTIFPDGILFNISEELECTQFGGSATQAKLLNSYFEPGVYPLWIMVADGVTANTKFPLTTNLLLGPGYIRSSGTYRIYRHVGFSTVFHNVTINADGSFNAYEDGIFFPLDTPEKVVLTYMVQTRLKGTFDVSSSPARIKDLEITGIYPTRSLLLLANESENYATAVNMASLDVDLNGNGVYDSVTFAATSQPAEIPLELWDP